MLVRVAVTVRTTPTSVGDAAPDSEQSPHWPAQSRALSFDVRQALGSREAPAEHRPQQRGELPTSAARIARVSDVIELRFIQAFGEQAVKSSIHSGCHRSPLEGCNAEPLDLDVWRPCAVVFAGAPACFDNCSRSHSHLEREAFLIRCGVAQRTNRLSTFLTRTPSVTTALTCAGAHAPRAPAISTAAQASQHSVSAMA